MDVGIFDDIGAAFADIPAKVPTSIDVQPTGFWDNFGAGLGGLVGLTATAYENQYLSRLPGYDPRNSDDEGEVTPQGVPTWAWFAIAGVAVVGIALAMRK